MNTIYKIIVLASACFSLPTWAATQVSESDKVVMEGGTTPATITTGEIKFVPHIYYDTECSLRNTSQNTLNGKISLNINGGTGSGLGYGSITLDGKPVSTSPDYDTYYFNLEGGTHKLLIKTLNVFGANTQPLLTFTGGYVVENCTGVPSVEYANNTVTNDFSTQAQFKIPGGEIAPTNVFVANLKAANLLEDFGYHVTCTLNNPSDDTIIVRYMNLESYSYDYQSGPSEIAYFNNVGIYGGQGPLKPGKNSVTLQWVSYRPQSVSEFHIVNSNQYFALNVESCVASSAP